MQTLSPPLNIEPVDLENTRLSIAIESGSNEVVIDQRLIRVYSVQGQESISQPFQLTVELRADDSERAGVRLDGRYLGYWAKIRVQMPAQDASSSSKQGAFGDRYFRGIIAELALGDPGVYTLTLQSPLHLLTLRNNYYIYSDCDIRQLITEVLAPELADPRFGLRFDFSDSPTLTRIQNWMQAGESSLDFLQRILAKAMIYYFFIHQEQQLILVFSDKPVTAKSVAIPGFERGPLPLRYTFSSVEPLQLKQYDIFAGLNYSVKLMPSNVKTRLSQVDPEWLNNTVASFHSHSAQQNHGASAYHHHINYDYGVNDEEVKDQLTKICQRIATDASGLSGTVCTPLLSPGYCFQLVNPLLESGLVEARGRPEFDQQVYAVSSIKHSISAETGYSGTVEATPLATTSDEQQQTYLNPFSMQATQQGSILAKVIDHEKPVGWRYRSKNNFQPEKGQVFFNGEMELQGECQGEAGCLVELATGQRQWVVLSRSSQSVPEINSMVLIGRSNSESEQPELQQVLASHGSKVIQPPDRRSASWQANTNWGSSYSTSYGDSISIHFGHNAQSDLPQAIRLVEGAYDRVGMANTWYGSSSYNKGGGWSVAISGNQSHPDEGVLSASISQGSSFNESHTAHSYSYGSVKLSESYGETDRSASVSVVGAYTPAPDLTAPSFIDGKLPQDLSHYSDALGSGDTFSRSSVLGRSISCNGVGSDAPDVDINTVLPNSHYNHSYTLGLSENINQTIGATFSDSLMVGASVSNSVVCAAQLSNALTLGPVVNTDMRIGSVNSLSTTIGPNTAINTQIADSQSLSTTIGSATQVQTNISNNTNINTTLGSSNDVSTFIGGRNSVNTFIGNSNDVSLTVAGRSSTQVNVGTASDTSVNVSARESTNINVGASKETSINVAARDATHINVGVANDTSINVAANTSQNISIADKTDTNISIGASTAMNISLSDSITMDNAISSSIAMRNSISSSIELINSLSLSAKIVNQSSAEVEIINGVTKAEMDMRQQAKLRATIAEIISGLDVKI